MQQLRRVLQRRAPSAAWHSSDEPKAIATAQLLTTRSVCTWPALREAHRLGWFATHKEFQAAVLDAFKKPAQSARTGWEPLDRTRARISAAVAELIDREGDQLVLVGHGTAWTLLVSEITGRAADLAMWKGLQAPDLCTVDLDTHTVSHPWGQW